MVEGRGSVGGQRYDARTFRRHRRARIANSVPCCRCWSTAPAWPATVHTCTTYPVVVTDPVMRRMQSANPEVVLVDIPADNPTLALRAIELLHQEVPRRGHICHRQHVAAAGDRERHALRRARIHRASHHHHRSAGSLRPADRGAAQSATGKGRGERSLPWSTPRAAAAPPPWR